jgi:hypothetical protein
MNLQWEVLICKKEKEKRIFNLLCVLQKNITITFDVNKCFSIQSSRNIVECISNTCCMMIKNYVNFDLRRSLGKTSWLGNSQDMCNNHLDLLFQLRFLLKIYHFITKLDAKVSSYSNWNAYILEIYIITPNWLVPLAVINKPFK